MPATTLSKSATLAADVRSLAASYGFHVTAKRSSSGDAIIEVSTSFAPDDASAYTAAEAHAYELLGMIPSVTYGSVWGSDSGSVGGHAALRSGNFHMCKSGVSKRVADAIQKGQW